jgi:trk system potassium uptake protein TrkH
MRNKFTRINSIFFFLGQLLQITGIVILLPLIPVGIYWGHNGEGRMTLIAFIAPALVSFAVGFVLRKAFRGEALDMTGAMLICALGWLAVSAVGALPFVIGIKSSFINAYFEAMSGFTTTGITMYMGLDDMPRSIIFWRALTQWVGGLGILSFFLAITFRAGAAHHIFGAESHKISSGRPAPGLFNTLKILWGIYVLFTVLSIMVLAIERMPMFDAICHSFTALSTGGFSPYDASIAHYGLSGHPHYRLIEYTLTFVMMLGGINFLIHYRVLTRDFKALWDNIEIRYWWRFIAAFTIIIMIDHFHKTGALAALFQSPGSVGADEVESTFRYSIFQVMSVLTTTGFGTKDIAADFFPALSKQLFLVMMVIGGCVGSTGGGVKVLRTAVLNRLMLRQLFRLRVSPKASSGLVIDRKLVPEDEVRRVAALFFYWIGLLVIGGAVTAFFSKHGALESLSGMFSALGNIGPCYMSVKEMIALHPAVKITYIFGMLAGRLEILPVLLLFSRRAWR